MLLCCSCRDFELRMPGSCCPSPSSSSSSATCLHAAARTRDSGLGLATSVCDADISSRDRALDVGRLARKLLRGQLPLGPLRKPVAALTRMLVRLPVVGSVVGFKPAAAAGGAAAVAAAGAGGAAANGDAAGGGAAASGADAAALKAERDKAARDVAVLAKELPPYVPNFTSAFEWICVHTGGRAVIDAIENNLSLPSHMLEPSRLSLYRYGNVSSASIWYELELVAEYGNMCGAQREDGALPPGGEAARRPLRKGDRIWQIAFGSGFKCNSAVWKCLKNH
jgi:hypothetical protein